MMFEHKESCPMDADQAAKLLEVVTNIDSRLQKIERYMLIGRVAVGTLAAAAATVWWTVEKAEEIRSALRQFMGY
jgi:hypothetical protein